MLMLIFVYLRFVYFIISGAIKENILTPSIKKAIDGSQTKLFKEICNSSPNPYGEGNTSNKIVETLIEKPLDNILHKNFFDITKS